jgi:hypothetical protein
MAQADVYVDRDGREISLAGLEANERKLVARLLRRARTYRDWNQFDVYSMNALAAFYDTRGVSRRAAQRTVPYRISRDLCGRLAVASGLVRASDYRAELDELIRGRFPSRRAFCDATGLSEDMLSHVLAGRKDLSLEKLTDALARIGYGLRIVPTAGQKQAPGRRRTG